MQGSWCKGVCRCVRVSRGIAGVMVAGVVLGAVLNFNHQTTLHIDQRARGALCGHAAYTTEQMEYDASTLRPATQKSNHDQFPFKYVLNEPNICDDQVSIINFIYVAPDRNGTRILIRSMWGQPTFFPYTGMKTLFLVAQSDFPHVNDDLRKESSFYHDIIQLDFVDSYANLTLKTLSMFHWTKTFCPGVKWILKSDTDVLVNPFSLSHVLDRNPADFVCLVLRKSRVCRETTLKCPQKWYVSEEEFSGTVYPPYCRGPAYVVKGSMGHRLYHAANKTHPFLIEDAYFTGILPIGMNATYQSFGNKYIKYRLRGIPINAWKDICLIENTDYYGQKAMDIWKYIVTKSLNLPKLR